MDLASSHVRLRPFGQAVDLDVDFGQRNRPGLVTTLLESCGEQGETGFWSSQPVGDRTAALLRLVAATEQRDHILMNARCRDAACGESFEFELPLTGLPGSTAGRGVLQVQLAEGRVVTIRRPTGEDLQRWSDAQPPSRAAARRLMIESLVVAEDVERGVERRVGRGVGRGVDGAITAEDEAALTAALAAADPLIDFTVSGQCSACGALNEVPVDLEALALARLAARQRTLLRDVHRLATHYGWTESVVFALPAQRRAQYLALIEEQR